VESIVYYYLWGEVLPDARKEVTYFPDGINIVDALKLFYEKFGDELMLYHYHKLSKITKDPVRENFTLDRIEKCGIVTSTTYEELIYLNVRQFGYVEVRKIDGIYQDYLQMKQPKIKHLANKREKKMTIDDAYYHFNRRDCWTKRDLKQRSDHKNEKGRYGIRNKNNLYDGASY
jgi:hypothetical protein